MARYGHSEEKKTRDKGDLHGIETSHPSFGMVQIGRVSGGSGTLFGTDFPQGHYIKLSIHEAKHTRNLSNDYYFTGRELVEINMSETQWARLLCSMNTQGVPCTLARREIEGKGYVSIEPLPIDTGAQGELHKAEVRNTAQSGVDAVRNARQAVEKMLSNPSLKKADLREVQSLLDTATREISANIEFVIDQAGEAIDKSKDNAMAEVESYVAMKLQELGGEHLRAMLAPGSAKSALETVCGTCSHLPGNHVESGCGVPDCPCERFTPSKEKLTDGNAHS
jgi:hypothetical protein